MWFLIIHFTFLFRRTFLYAVCLVVVGRLCFSFLRRYVSCYLTNWWFSFLFSPIIQCYWCHRLFLMASFSWRQSITCYPSNSFLLLVRIILFIYSIDATLLPVLATPFFMKDIPYYNNCPFLIHLPLASPYFRQDISCYHNNPFVIRLSFVHRLFDAMDISLLSDF